MTVKTKFKTKKCRCRTCGRKYTARGGYRYELRGGKFVKVGIRKPRCVGECHRCFGRIIDRWLAED